MASGLSRSNIRLNTISGSGSQISLISGVTSPVSAVSVASTNQSYANAAGYQRVFHKFTGASSITFNNAVTGVNNYNPKQSIGGMRTITGVSVGTGITAIIIGGGGSVLGVKRTGGGGGGGYRYISEFAASLSTPYAITVGAAQGSSSVFGYTANAGGNEGGSGGSGGGGPTGGGAGGESLTCPLGTGVPWNPGYQGSYGTKGGAAGDASGGGGGGAGGAAFNKDGLTSPPIYPTSTFATNPGGYPINVFGDDVGGGGTGGYHGGGTAPAGPPIGGGGGGGGDGSGGSAGNSGAVYISYLTPY